MTDTPQTKEMKRYLFHEMSAAEREALEERLFSDDRFFYDLAELEDDLIDGYVRGGLSGNDLTAFERSLEKTPERREKVRDARALQNLIATENPVAAPVAAPSFIERCAAFFRANVFNLRYAVGALAILLVCAAGLLVYRNWQAQQEFAEIEKRREAERIEKENQLRMLEEQQRRTEEERRRNETNQTSPNAVNAPTAPPTANQSAEESERKDRIEKLRREIQNDRERKLTVPRKSPPPAPFKEFVAVAIAPAGRGGNVGAAPTAALVGAAGKQRVKITKELPADKNYVSFEITANGKTITTAAIPEGAKTIEFTVPTDTPDFEIKATERNTRSGSESLGSYSLKLTRNR